ncbi:RNA-binding protein 12 [Hetaerina americana]|uniref:RNA-binding protein 12 n=1 Tax=Hetaerina americana TaxID=62018 RepID=UPI003A7F5B1B
MSVIIRLQNLPWSANALDIRQYFRGLSIPEGGVHIVGGEQGDAFIAFSTDEDARQAMMLDGGKIKEVKIRLLLSSRAQMQKVIEVARQQTMGLQSFMAPLTTAAPTHPMQAAHMVTHPLASAAMHGQSLGQPIGQPMGQPIGQPIGQSMGQHMPPVMLGHPGIGPSTPGGVGQLGGILPRPLEVPPRMESAERSVERGRSERSHSRDGDRRDRRDRDRRRRRDRSKSRSRSRERGSRRRGRSRSRSRSRDKERSSRSDRGRDAASDDGDKRSSAGSSKDQNGDVVVVAHYPAPGRGRPLASQRPSSLQPMTGPSPPLQKGVPQRPQGPMRPMGIPNGANEKGGTGEVQHKWPMDAQQQGGGALRGLPGTPLLRNAEHPGVAASSMGSDGGMNMGGIAMIPDSLPGGYSATEGPRFPRNERFLPSGGMVGGQEGPPRMRPSGWGGPRAEGFAPGRPMGHFGADEEQNEFEGHSEMYEGHPGRPFRGAGRDPQLMEVGGSGGRPYIGRGSQMGERGPYFEGRTPMDRRQYMGGREGPMPGLFEGGEFHRGSHPQFDRLYGRFGGENVSEERFSDHKPTQRGRAGGGGNCVEVRNMPLEAGYREVREFFKGLHISSSGLKVINDNHGNRVGICYVKFVKAPDREIALNLNGRLMQGSAVEVLTLDDEIFERAIDSYRPSRNPMYNSGSNQVTRGAECLALVGLPHYAKEQDVMKILKDYPLVDIVLEKSKDGKGRAYVQFSTQEDAEKALSNKFTMDQKPLSVIRSSTDKFNEVKKALDLKSKREVTPPDQVASANDESKLSECENNTDAESKTPMTECIILRGLPDNANDREILDFFSDTGLVPFRIHIMLDTFGNPSGDAFCEFSCREEIVQALTKANSPMGKNNITVQAVPVGEMHEALGVPPKPIKEQLPTEERLHNGGGGGGSGRGGGPMGRVSQGLLGHNPASLSPSHPPSGSSGTRPPLLGRHPMPGPPLLGMRGAPHHDGMPPSGMMSGQGPEMSAVEGFGKPGCVIAMKNVPYKAGVEEILDFFRAFDVSRENVIRRYSDQGMPTGDARVAFISPSEAQRALRELHYGKIRDRSVYLTLL